jgi:hypothetical protein
VAASCPLCDGLRACACAWGAEGMRNTCCGFAAAGCHSQAVWREGTHSASQPRRTPSILSRSLPRLLAPSRSAPFGGPGAAAAVGPGAAAGAAVARAPGCGAVGLQGPRVLDDTLPFLVDAAGDTDRVCVCMYIHIYVCVCLSWGEVLNRLNGGLCLQRPRRSKLQSTRVRDGRRRRDTCRNPARGAASASGSSPCRPPARR